MKEDTRPPDIDDEDLASADDAVIGTALKRSLLALGVAAVVIGLAVYLARRPREEAPEILIEAAAPIAVENRITPPDVQFTDITRQAGIEFVHFNGATGDKLLPETMGSGAAFFDYDNDDDPDLLLVNSTFWPHSDPVSPAPTSALYRNDGAGNFEDVTRRVGLDISLYGTGVAIGDYDADGRRDVFLTAVGENRLLRNLGDHFEDVTARAGVAGEPQAWSSSAGFFDADNDGDLDLFVCNYVRWSRQIDFDVDFRLVGVGRAYGPPFNYEGTHSYLYRNEGNGSFTDITAVAGIQVGNPATGVPVGKALGLLPIDLDADGWMDIFIANDTVRNFFFHNQGDGTFEEVGELWGLAYGRNGEATGAMGADAAAYRNDPEMAIAIGNFANEMTSLYLSQGDPTLFADESIIEGIGAPSRQMLSFGVLFFDYDLDGRLDILQVNGHLEDEIDRVDPSQTYAQPSQLFWNTGPDQRQTFIPVPAETTGGLAIPLVGRGSAVADIDGDGDQDVVLTQTGSSPLLLRNDQNLGHHWIRLKLQGEGANLDAIGAWLELAAGGVTQRRQVMRTRSYQSQSTAQVVFGLGESPHIEALEITWPDGVRQKVTDLVADQFRLIRREG